MPLPRRSFITMLDDVIFAFETPMNYFDADAQPMPASFSAADTWATLMKMDSAIELSWIALYGRPVTQGSVQHWLQLFAKRESITASQFSTGSVGGLAHHHPALFAVGKQTVDGQPIDLSIAAFEDGGHAFIAIAASIEAITADYLPTLEYCIRTIELEQAHGPTVPLLPQQDTPSIVVIEHDKDLPMPRDANEVWHRHMAKKRDAAVADAKRLVADERYDEAEQIVLAADSSIMGVAAIGRMYTDALTAAVASGAAKRNRSLAEALFTRALQWRQSAYPEPHTAFEAKDYERGRADDRQALIAILGYDPSAT